LYIIPKNVKTKFEFFSGFGWKELFISVLFLLLGAVAFFLMGIFTTSMFRLIVVAMITAIGVFIGIEDPRSGRSFIGFVSDYRKYKNKPHRYEYRFKKG